MSRLNEYLGRKVINEENNAEENNELLGDLFAFLGEWTAELKLEIKSKNFDDIKDRYNELIHELNQFQKDAKFNVAKFKMM